MLVGVRPDICTIDVPSRTVVQQNAYGASGRHYFFPVVQTDISVFTAMLNRRPAGTDRERETVR